MKKRYFINKTDEISHFDAPTQFKTHFCMNFNPGRKEMGGYTLKYAHFTPPGHNFTPVFKTGAK